MKAKHVLIVLFLVSNITLSSGFLGVLAAAASYVFNRFFERDGLLPFDSKRLKADLNESLFGQHIVSDVVLKAVSSFMTDRNPNKPLVLSFHGTTGVGKNHVAKIIARNVYKKGENSKHIHTFISEHHFPHKEKSDLYSAQLKQWIHGNVSRFPRSMFIFDEMDKMNPQLIDVIKPFLDYNTRVDGVSFRSAIFIFLSNAGGSLIADMALDFWREGNNREELWMNSKELETKISQNIFNDNGLQYSAGYGPYPNQMEELRLDTTTTRAPLGTPNIQQH
ncbi:torsin-1B-like isoform X2 [Ctenopharyngodon idella]|uniref:torsin-1B-like isoform X2 n=1 Tax=Ctenopharyngodon idella TaxID=7959 RepID=UPI0022319C10|nr:torsin-1B-like isoform X2 [Ctenopharyngodon idella]